MTLLKSSNFDTTKTVVWPKHLSTPAELVQAIRDKTRLRIVRSPLCSKIILQFVGSWAYILAHVLNKSKVFNIETFNQELRRIEGQIQKYSREVDGQQHCTHNDDVKRAPLITFSNHISCIDDPILWGTLLPFNYYSTNTDSVRWSAAAVDICFSKPWHSTFFSLGKTFPIIRGIGLNQPAMEFAFALLKHNQWLHLFPEGRVMRDEKQQKISNLERGYKFKWGISKLILDYLKSDVANHDLNSEKQIRILPFYHLGLDDILPIGWPYIPRFNKKISVFIRPSVIEMNSRLLSQILSSRTLSSRLSSSKSNDEMIRIKLTNFLEEEMEKLMEPATRLHYANIN